MSRVSRTSGFSPRRCSSRRAEPGARLDPVDRRPGRACNCRASEVTQCVPIPGRTDGAEVRGRMQVNGEGDYPFVARAMDGGAPGSALDRVELEVNTGGALDGDAAPGCDDEFTCSASGNLVAGDVQWIIADIADLARHAGNLQRSVARRMRSSVVHLRARVADSTSISASLSAS